MVTNLTQEKMALNVIGQPTCAVVKLNVIAKRNPQIYKASQGAPLYSNGHGNAQCI